MTPAGVDLDEQVQAALAGVYDPCSVACSTPLSIVEMGLVLGWEYDAETRVLQLDMTVTSPGCFMVRNIIEAVERRFEPLEAVKRVVVRMHNDRVWTPAMMSDSGRETLAVRRREAVARIGLEPQQWRERAAC
ncbi:MAG TPA: iron-sulfur cluster assembly protein [Conexibacter sp.]|nr:iron-sulfur cluster assembly protein [Conexibacter sp.]